MIHPEEQNTGSVAATIVAAGIGACACGLFYILSTFKSLNAHLALYPPSGALSGVSTAAITVWLVTWVILLRRWQHRSISLKLAGRISILLLLLGFLFTFPPIARIF